MLYAFFFNFGGGRIWGISRISHKRGRESMDGSTNPTFLPIFSVNLHEILSVAEFAWKLKGEGGGGRGR